MKSPKRWHYHVPRFVVRFPFSENLVSNVTRRQFGQASLGSLLTFALLETIYERDAFAKEAAPLAAGWFNQVNELGLDLKGAKISQADWQKHIEALFAKVNLPDLLNLVDFEKLTKGVTPPDNGARSLRFQYKQVEGMPTNLAYGKQIFALKKGRSVVPHGHNNMATAFIILKGQFAGKHYDRIEDQTDHIVIRPTIDRTFKPGEYSTVTDIKDNVHWFKAVSEPAFIFNIHALNVAPGSEKKTGRVYVDPNGEKLSDGLVRAPRINHDQAHKLYG